MPVVQIQQAKKKAAQELGFTLPELVRHFIANFLREPVDDKREWLSPEAEERLTKEVEDFYTYEFNDSKAYTSTKALMEALEVDD